MTVTRWEGELLSLSQDEVRDLVVKTKEEMNKEGRLEFDWKQAKERKAAQKAGLAAATPPH